MHKESINQFVHAEFIKSAEKVTDCPPADKPEYSFIGRSNVGKSSLINLLIQRRNLALTSNKPGKTKTLNHYLVDKSWYLVDLPGYGYAQVSKTDRRKYEQIIRNYLTKRENLILTFILIDSNISPQAIDLEFISWMGLQGLPFYIVFTKTDKSKPGRIEQNIQSFNDMLGNTWEELPPMITTSAQEKQGREEILNEIKFWNEKYAESIKQQDLK